MSDTPFDRENLVKSKQRVADHGEVFSPNWMVEDMFNLVKGESERIDSRFLEPACGDGNFLKVVLQRKLATVNSRYGKSEFERNHYALFGLMCIYGIELLEDNVQECRENLLDIFARFLKIDGESIWYKAAKVVLAANVIRGDALTLQTPEEQPIKFPEWGYLGGGKFQRRDFRYDSLTQISLGGIFDSGEKHEIFAPFKTYPADDGSGDIAVTQASFALKVHNPDVLTCIANLSNDEVFTPPEFANQMLDTLQQSWASSNDGENIWSNKEVTFLDPCTKSGVFLREIVKRLNDGLTKEIPDLTERINHILTKQVFGIGITELTSLLARRSVYCSKYANGIHSIARTFTNDDGNVWFERTEHTWVNGKCKFCSASKAEYGRSESLETHAYKFIHADEIRTSISEIYGEDMHFDVIIGNPPYQLSDGGFGTSAVPIYNKFVEQAKKLEPRFLSMVVPARWFAGGRGLDDFRASMLNDDRLRVIHDFPDSNDVFPGTQIKGGVLYFLWERDNRGGVSVTTHDKGSILPTVVRPLLEPGCDVFIRYNEGVSILRKVLKAETKDPKKPTLPDDRQLSGLVSSLRPFGFRTYFKGKAHSGKNDVMVYQNGGVGYTPRKDVLTGTELIDHWKVFIPRAGSGSDAFPHPILGKPFVGAPGSICSETYLCIGPLKSEREAKSMCSYLSTRLVRFLILLHKPTQDATRSVYTFVPKQDFSGSWTDETLYKKYGITKDEIAFIESMIRPMELDNE